MRGLDDGLLLDLWNFPSAFGSSRAKALARLREKLRRLTTGPVRFGRLLGEVRHNVTFRSIRVQVYPTEIASGNGNLRWLPLTALEKAAISRLTRKIATKIPKEGLERI